MKKWILSVGIFALTACTSTVAITGSASASGMAAPSEEEPPAAPSADTGAIVPADQPPDLPNMGPAPELENEIWLNVDGALRLADLRGSVVALDMWTFGCINCQHVIPSLREWHEEYNDDGLVVIGNHYPEFQYEADLDNLKEALVRLDVPYAVAQDNDRKTWGAYNNRYWPTLYLIDKWGNIRYVHYGEGRYREIEAAILALLAEDYVEGEPPAYEDG